MGRRVARGLRRVVRGEHPVTSDPLASLHSNIRRREIAAMRSALPFLADVLPERDTDLDETYKAACQLIALHHAPAKEAAHRTALKSIGTQAALREIAQSDIREGIPYSANVKKFPDIWNDALPMIRDHEEAYGAAVFTGDWPSYSRGRALAFYFENNPPTGRILHVGPEPEAEEWFRGRLTSDANKGEASYVTMDIGGNRDLHEDLTALNIDDESFDWVICHRVMEHIFDEDKALGEIRRVLRPGGVLNISVPESMHVAKTMDWCFPDTSHHSHYRHYGADVTQRLADAQFDVDLVRWSLDQPVEKTRQAGTYPLRMYNAHR